MRFGGLKRRTNRNRPVCSPRQRRQTEAHAATVLALTSFVMPSHNDAHVSKPPTLTEQIERTWGLDEMGDCKNTSHGLTDSPSLPKSSLDDGDWKCVAYTDSQRTELTIHINGNRVGLYKADGTVLKPVGKD